jgi:hypothetical protein
MSSAASVDVILGCDDFSPDDLAAFSGRQPKVTHKVARAMNSLPKVTVP